MIAIQPTGPWNLWRAAWLVAAVTALAYPPATPGHASSGDSTDQAARGSRIAASEALAVSVIQRGKLRGTLSVRLALLTAPEHGPAPVEAALPVLRDRMLAELNAYAGEDLDLGRPVDVAALTLRLQRVVDGVLGAGKAALLIESATATRRPR